MSPPSSQDNARMARFHSRRDHGNDDLPKVKISLGSLREAGQLFGYLLPYWPRFLGALLVLMLASALGLVFPYVTGTLVDGALTRFMRPGAAAELRWHENIDVIGG